MEREAVLGRLEAAEQDELFRQLAKLVQLLGADLSPRHRSGTCGLAKVLLAAAPGDQLAFRRPGMRHWHHGIYAGCSGGTAYIWDLAGPAHAPTFEKRDLDEAARGAETAVIVDYGPCDSEERRTETLRIAEWIAPVFNAIQRGADPIPWSPQCTCDCLTLFCRTGGCVAEGRVAGALSVLSHPVRTSFKP